MASFSSLSWGSSMARFGRRRSRMGRTGGWWHASRWNMVWLAGNELEAI